MSHAIPSPTFSVQEAAAAIVRLINSSPQSPRQEEIEAIIAKALQPAVSGAAPASPLLTRIRETAARLEDAFEAHAKVIPGDPVEGTAEDRVEQIEAELEALEGEIPSPPQSFADLVAWAEIARAGADVRDDGTLGEASAPDVFERPAARLVEAVLQFGGSSPRILPGMSPAHAAHYREWRGLIDHQHMRQFEGICHDGMTKAEIETAEARIAAHLEVIDAVAARIFAEPPQTWGDVMLYAQVCFWCHWSGIDPEGADAGPQLDAGPMSRGKAPDAALGKLLEAIFMVAGIGPLGKTLGGQP
jgi:hypothetical protein